MLIQELFRYYLPRDDIGDFIFLWFFSLFLNIGLQKRVDVTVIAATNRPDNIDPALLRPGKAKHDTVSIYFLACTYLSLFTD